MKRLLPVLLILPLLLWTACDDEKEELPYINCKWVKTRTLINLQFLEIVYCVSNCPDGDVIHDCAWVHLYQDTKIVEYQYTGSSSINTWDLTNVTSYTYEER